MEGWLVGWLVGRVSFDRPERCTGALSCRRCRLNTFFTYCTYFYHLFYIYFLFSLLTTFSLFFHFTFTIPPFFFFLQFHFSVIFFQRADFFDCLGCTIVTFGRSLVHCSFLSCSEPTNQPTNHPLWVLGIGSWPIPSPSHPPLPHPVSCSFRLQPPPHPNFPCPLPSRHAQCK